MLSTRERVSLLTSVAILVAMAVFCFMQLEVRTGLSSFLSDDSDVLLARVSRELANSDLTRRMILSLSSPEPDAALAAAAKWEPILRSHPEVKLVRGGPDPDFAEAIFELYFPHRFLFLSDHPESELDETFSDGNLDETAHTLRSKLIGPESEWIKSIATQDPFLSFPQMLTRFEAARMGPLDTYRGRFVAKDEEGLHAILFLETRHSPFDTKHQAPLDVFLKKSFLQLSHQQDTPLHLDRSAVHRFAIASEQQTRSDLTRIGGVSSLAIALAFLALFGSARYILLAALPLAAGILTATTMGILLFGGLHGMTLAFGATLLGICIDYPIHYINHHTLKPDPRGPRASLGKIWIGLLLGALTTIAGFAGLSASNLPGIREIGIFSSSGILAALFTTRILLPPLLPNKPRPTALQVRLTSICDGIIRGLISQRRSLIAVLLLALGICAIGLPRARFQDNLWNASAPLNKGWLDEDEQVRSLVSRMDAGRFVVVMADTDEAALQANDKVYEALEASRIAGAVEDFRSLHTFLWSASLQQRNATAIESAGELANRSLAALERAGFRRQSFDSFSKALADVTRQPPLTLPELMDSPLRDVVEPFLLRLEDKIVLLSFLRGVTDASALAAQIADIPEAQVFDQQAFMATTYKQYRLNTIRLVFAGLLLVTLVAHLRYRKAKLTLTAVGPAFLAAASTIALLSLAGVPISLFHLLGTLLILSFGVDYSIFLVESTNQRGNLPVTLLSLCLAWLSTLLAFGLLAVSTLPAFRAIGISTGIGITLALLLAPTALLLSFNTEEHLGEEN